MLIHLNQQALVQYMQFKTNRIINVHPEHSLESLLHLEEYLQDLIPNKDELNIVYTRIKDTGVSINKLKEFIDRHNPELLTNLNKLLYTPYHLCAVYSVAPHLIAIVHTFDNTVDNEHIHYKLFAIISAFLINDKTFRQNVAEIFNTSEFKLIDIPKEDIKSFDIFRRNLIKRSQAEQYLKLWNLSKKNNIENLINDIQSRILDLQTQLKQQVKKLRELQYQQFLLNTNAEDSEELLNFLTFIHDHIIYMRKETSLKIFLKAYMSLGNADIFFSSISNTNHVLHDRPLVASILRAVHERKIKLPVYAEYIVDLEYMDIKSEQVHTLTAYKEILNSHISKYNCYSEHKQLMLEHLQQNDLISLLQQMLECTSSVYVYDNAVISDIINQIEHKINNLTIQVRTTEGWKDIPLKEWLKEEGVEE